MEIDRKMNSFFFRNFFYKNKKNNQSELYMSTHKPILKRRNQNGANTNANNATNTFKASKNALGQYDPLVRIKYIFCTTLLLHGLASNSINLENSYTLYLFSQNLGSIWSYFDWIMSNWNWKLGQIDPKTGWRLSFCFHSQFKLVVTLFFFNYF